VRSAGVSRTGAEDEPGLSRPEQKRRRVTWGRRCASVEIPVVKQSDFLQRARFSGLALRG
jgi:hypothetical protein